MIFSPSYLFRTQINRVLVYFKYVSVSFFTFRHLETLKVFFQTTYENTSLFYAHSPVCNMANSTLYLNNIMQIQKTRKLTMCQCINW